MLERYYTRPETWDRYRASWIAGPIEQYVKWLEENHYTAKRVLKTLPVLLDFGAFARRRGASSVSALPEHVDAFVARRVKERTPKGAPPSARGSFVYQYRWAVQRMIRL